MTTHRIAASLLDDAPRATAWLDLPSDARRRAVDLVLDATTVALLFLVLLG